VGLGLEACWARKWAGGNVHDIELLYEIKRKLDQARNLTVEAGGFTLFYLIEMAILECEEMAKKREPAGDSNGKDRAHALGNA